MNVQAFAAPYRHWIIDGLVPADLCRAACDCLPPPAWPGWVRYRNDCESKRTSRELAALGEPVRRLFEALVSRPVLAGVRGLSAMLGVPLSADPTWHGAGIHVSDPGDFLGTHLDYGLHPTLLLERRASLVLFLSPEWAADWGGAFEVYDGDGATLIRRVVPEFGRAVLFENSDLSYHGAGAVAPHAPPRVTAACYYLAAPRPGCVRRRALFVPRR